MKSSKFHQEVIVQLFNKYHRKLVFTVAKKVGATVVKEFSDFGRVYNSGIFGGPEYAEKTIFMKLHFSNGKGPAELRDQLITAGLIFNQNGMSEFKLLSSLFSPTVSTNNKGNEIPLDYTPGAETVAEITANKRKIAKKMFHINQNTLCPHCCTRLEAKLVHDALLPNDVIFFCPKCEKM